MPSPITTTKTKAYVRPAHGPSALSAGMTMVVVTLSAVLLAIALSMSHGAVSTLLDRTGLLSYLNVQPMGGPPLVLWSWQHNDDLSYLDTEKVGVAYLVGTFTIDGKRLDFARSLARVKLPENIYRIAAIRLETKTLDKSSAGNVAEDLSSRIVATALESPHRVDAIQIDFDAKQSERVFYAGLLRKVRAKLPAGVKLSITSLASWCLGDNWISGAHLPVDEVVPMLFTMGLEHKHARGILTKPGVLSPQMFGGRMAPGLSINEPQIFTVLGNRLRHYRRLYVFSSRGWSQARFQNAVALLGEQGAARALTAGTETTQAEEK